MTRFLALTGLLLACFLGTPAGVWSQERDRGTEELPPPQVLPPAPAPQPTPEVLPPAPAPQSAPQALPAAALPLPPAVGPSCPSCPPRTVCVPRLTLMEEQHATTIPQMRVREEVVGRACGLDVEYREQRQVVTEWQLKPREVIQEVPCTTMKPVTVTDPHTGQCRTEYRSCPIVRQVKVTVYCPVPVERLVAVAVPCLKPGKPMQVSKLAVDCTIEPAIETRLRLLTMPNQVTVPPCCALPPAPHP